MNGFPFRRHGGQIDGDPIEVSFIGLVKLAVERGRIISGEARHLADINVLAKGWSGMLQVNSPACFRQLSV